jgi:3-oxoacyl-(acyl-carrier-protein) synthase
VTGWALRTPLGNSIDEVTRRLLAGERAAQRNPRFPIGAYACRLAASIPGDPKPSQHSRVLRRIGLLALEAGHEAMTDAGCEGGPRLGLFSAMGGLRANWSDIMPALAGQRSDLSGSWDRGFKKLHPFWMLQHLSNNAHALLAADIDARGDGVTFSGSNAGAQALVAATHALQDGVVDAALVIAYDSLIEPETIVEMAARGALATCDLEELAAPYDDLANGQVPGEATAALVLESADRARDRARTYLSAADGADGRKREPAAETVARVVSLLARDDRVVDGCSLARPELDAEERRALASVLGPTARLTALQASTGSLGAATSPVQAIALASLLNRGQLPPVAALRQAAPAPLSLVSRAESTGATSAVAIGVGAPGLVGAVRVSNQGIVRRAAWR